MTLSCSCLGHAAIMGGLLFGLSDIPHRKLDIRESRALVVTLIPLDSVGQSRALSPGKEEEDSKVSLSRDREEKTEDKVRQPVVALKMASVAQGLQHDAAVRKDVGSPSAAPNQTDFNDYQRRLYEALAQNSRYPADARRLHLSGVTQLAFKVDRSGTVLDSWIQESSGSELLDDAALETLARAQPLPPIPASMPARMDFVIEIDLSILQQYTSR